MAFLDSLFLKIFRIGIGLAFSVLICSVLIQVLGRTFGNSPVWTEELSRFSLLYIAAFGAGLSLRSGELVNVDIFCDSLKGRGPWLCQLFASFVTALLSLVLLRPAWRFFSIGQFQSSPALGVRMDFMHVSIMILLISLFIFSSLQVIRLFHSPSSASNKK